MTNLILRTVSDIETLRSFEVAHQTLFASCDKPHIGTSFAYVIADVVGRDQSELWRYFAVFQNEAMVGCMYGRRAVRNIYGVPLPVFEIGTKDVGDTLLQDCANERVLRLLIEAMLEDQHDCVVFTFKRMDRASFEILHRCLRTSRRRFAWKWAGYGFCIDTCGTETNVLRNVSRGRRGDLNRRQRRLVDQHAYEYRCHQSPNVGWNLERLEEFMALEDSGWKGTAQTSIKRRPGYESYHKELIVSAARAGIAAWYALRIGEGRPIAMYLCLRSHRALWLPKVAYDERYARFAPGLLLTHRILQDCIESNEIDEIKFISGPSWLHGWNPSRNDYRSLMLFGDSRMSRLVRIAFQSRGFAQRWLLGIDPMTTERDTPYL